MCSLLSFVLISVWRMPTVPSANAYHMRRKKQTYGKYWPIKVPKAARGLLIMLKIMTSEVKYNERNRTVFKPWKPVKTTIPGLVPYLKVSSSSCSSYKSTELLKDWRTLSSSQNSSYERLLKTYLCKGIVSCK